MALDCYSPEVVGTLETLISPGTHSRISPLVEAAQARALGHVEVRKLPSASDIRDWLKACPEQVHSWAETLWGRRCTGANDFSRLDYDDTGWQAAYLAYYFPFTVAKLQLLFVDLVRMRRLSGDIRLLDIGVGAGSTFVGFLDFALAWNQACRLHGATFPLTSIELAGIDRSRSCIETTKSVLSAFGDCASQFLLPGWREAIDLVRLEEADLGREPYIGGYVPNLLVAANILNELIATGNYGEEHLRGTMGLMEPGGIAIIVDPANESNGQRLSEWRGTLLDTDPHWRTLGPCAPEHATGPGACICWNFRKESLHEPALLRSVRAELDKISKDPRGMREFSNGLLKWSYTVLERSAVAVEAPPDARSRMQLRDGMIIDDPLELRFLGTFCKNDGNGGNDYVQLNPGRDLTPGDSGGREEYVRTCPGVVGNAKSLMIKRRLGYKLPALRYGEAFSAAGLKVAAKGSDQFVLEASGDATTVSRQQPELAGNGFIDTSTYHLLEPVLDEFANRMFGFGRLHKFQHRILRQVLAGRSILGIAATGGGKSECFILPSMLLPGLTVVVSPLKALMTDQYEQRIKERYGLHQVTTWLNGGVDVSERMKRLSAMERGFYKLAYFTPEQLERSYVLDSLARANETVGVRYLAMDEAHCISQWGHDFRPAYLNVLRRLKAHGIEPCVIALTATASPQVRQDICEELLLNPAPIDEGGCVYIDSSNRVELNLIVRAVPSTDEKVSLIVEQLRDLLHINASNKDPGAAIVFMPHTGGSPDDVKPRTANEGRLSAGVSKFASYLERQLGTKVALYHGQMDDDSDVSDSTEPGRRPQVPLGNMSGRRRRPEQIAFIKGERDIMVATKGFGMGVDKPNIRVVLHRSPPGNLEAYAQEAGRAGRDGELASAVLLYSPDRPHDQGGYRPESSDHEIQEFFLSQKYIRPQDIRIMRAFLATVKRQLSIPGAAPGDAGQYLYFTNDEAIEFFNACTIDASLAGALFAWPKFVERNHREKEFGVHREILDKGYLYDQRTGYLKRILAALYRLRPSLQGQKLVFLESCQDVSAWIPGAHLNHWADVIASNLYFGKILRDSGLTGEGFRSLLNGPDILPLAARLALPLAETVAMLNDIRNAEQGRLLDYKVSKVPLYGPAAGRSSVAAWRDYAGALKRDYRAKDNAARERREPTLDDYFGPKQLPKPIGWEVRLGNAMLSAEFDGYLASFVDLHDRRQENDRQAYLSLITDYIGARPDGALRHGTAERQCLRAALLGYLKTNEVVVGGNCRSCSTCVPDGRFDRYSKEERRAVVARIRDETASLLDRIGAASTNQPSRKDVDDLFATIESEEREGRSLLRYVALWSARLIQDTPGHRGGSAFRFEAMSRGLLEFDVRQYVSVLQSLAETTDGTDLRLLSDRVREDRERLRGNADALWIMADIARRLANAEAEQSALDEMIKVGPQVARFRLALDRLISLHQEGGLLANEVRHRKELVQRALVAESAWEAENRFAQLVTEWDWGNVETQFARAIRFGYAHGAAGLLTAWLRAKDRPSVDCMRAIDAMETVLSSGTEIGPETAQVFLNIAGCLEVLERPALSLATSRSLIEPDSAPPLSGVPLEFATEMLFRGKALPRAAVRRVAESLGAAKLRSDSSATALASEFCVRLLGFKRVWSSTSKPEGKDFSTLWGAFGHGTEVQDDMLVQAIRALRQRCRSTTWKTPASREFQALVRARRYREAEELAVEVSDLRMQKNNEPASEYLERARARAPERTPAASQLRLYDVLAAALM